MTLDDLRLIIRKNEKWIQATVDDLVRYSDSDTIREWFRKLIETSPACCTAFGLPRSKDLEESLHTLLRSDAEFAWTISRLLAQRLNIYLALIPEITTHPFADAQIKTLRTKLLPIFSLVRRSGPAPRTRNVEVVATAMEAGDLSVFKESLVDTDLWTVLKTLYESSTGDPLLRRRLYDFVFEQLLHEMSSPCWIPQERHSWWAIVMLLKANYPALQGQAGHNTLQNIIKALLTRPEAKHSSVEQILRSSPVPELYSEEREQLLVGNNLCYLLSLPKAMIDTEIREALRTRLLRIAEQYLTDQEPALFKIACTQLWFAYDLALFLTREETEQMLALPQLEWENHRVGRNYYSAGVVAQIKTILVRARGYVENPSTWTSTSLSAGLVCGGPGQGKTELMKQLTEVLPSLEGGKRQRWRIQEYTVGNNIQTEEDVRHIFDKLDRKMINIVTIDEIDKAPFDLARLFLGPLERSSGDKAYRRTFWIFGQSSFENFDAYERAALKTFEQTGNASLRDFLTRLKWGVVEIPNIRFVPVQRVLSAIRMLYNAGYQPTWIDKTWVRQIALDTTVDTNRELRKKAIEVTALVNDHLTLRALGEGRNIASHISNDAWPAPRVID